MLKFIGLKGYKRNCSRYREKLEPMKPYRFWILLFLCGFISFQEVSAQYFKEAMRGYQKINVKMIKLSSDAVKNKISSYMFTGKLERELASVGARLTTESEAEAYAVIDVTLSDAMGIAYGYQVRIRFMRVISNEKKSKTMKKVPITVWETARLGYSSKIDLRSYVEETYQLVLLEFLADYSEANN